MDTSLNILVINVKSSIERRVRITKQLDKLGLPYRILEATVGNDLTNDWIENNIGDRFKKIYYEKLHYSVNKNALACADSHRRAQLIASELENCYTLILEDDVEFTNGFKKKVNNIIKLMDKHKLHVAFLGYHWEKGTFKKRLDIDCAGCGFSIYRYPEDGHVSGAHSYLVDSIGAKKLVEENIDKIQDTADSYFIKEKGLNDSTVVLYPKLTTVGYLESDIGYPVQGPNIFYTSKKMVFSLSLKYKPVYYLLRFWKERRL